MSWIALLGIGGLLAFALIVTTIVWGLRDEKSVKDDKAKPPRQND